MSGGADGFEVEPDSLSALGSALGAAHSELNSSLERLAAGSHALSGGWSGAAQQAYLARYAAWSTEMQQLAATLRAAAVAARDNAESYRHADDRVAELWRI